MRRQRRSIAVVTAAPAMLATLAHADLTSLRTEIFVDAGWLENGYADTGLTTYRLYADFDGVGEEGVLAAFGLPGDPMHAESSDGLFHNDPLFDSSGPPQDLTFFGLWSNQWDTYVTINTTSAAKSPVVLTNFFEQETNGLASNWSTTSASWFVTRDDVVHRPVDGRVLLAQFSVAAGVEISGEVGLLLADGRALRHAFGSSCSADLDGDRRVGFEDLLAILATWGPCVGCPEDLDGNDRVDFADLVIVLASWGPCFGAQTVDLICACCDRDVCLVDIDGCGCVGFNDLIAILVAMGLPCDGCAEDVDCNGVVDTRDLVIELDWWGRLPESCP